MYLLQFPFVAGFAKYLYGFEPKKHYLLNKFSVAGFYFYEGTNLLEKMKPAFKFYDFAPFVYFKGKNKNAKKTA